MLDSTQEAAVVAMVCGPPPTGRARWTVRLVAEEAIRRRIAEQMGRETARVTLARSGLKPWRKKMWCVPELTSEFVERMEDVLRLYARKLDPKEPVVCLDERPVVLRENARRGLPMKPGRIKRTDYEYVRWGTANIFCIIEPLTGRRLTFAAADRKRPALVRALQKIALRYRDARRIHLVFDNLNTHSLKSPVEVLGALEGRRLWRRFEVHHTPKHASWLNAAEMEASLVSRECLGRERVASLVDLISRVSAWRREAESAGRIIDWRFRVADARREFRYDGLATARSQH